MDSGAGYQPCAGMTESLQARIDGAVIYSSPKAKGVPSRSHADINMNSPYRSSTTTAAARR
jgi:hypothetical protein